jgi:hypothetical protein
MPLEGAGPLSARGQDGKAGVAQRGAASTGLEHISQYPCSNAQISKILNKSAQSGE